MVESNEKNSNNWEQVFQTTSWIVLVQIIITLVLIVLGWFFATSIDNSVNQRAISLMWMTIILFVIGSFVLRRILFSQKYLEKSVQENKLLLTLQTNTVFLSLIGILIAIIGFLIASLSGNKFEILRAGAISLLIFIFNFPRRPVWQNIVGQLFKVSNENK